MRAETPRVQSIEIISRTSDLFQKSTPLARRLPLGQAVLLIFSVLEYAAESASNEMTEIGYLTAYLNSELQTVAAIL